MSDKPSSRPGKGNSGRGGRGLSPPPSRSGRAPVEGRGGKGKGKGRGRGAEDSARSQSSTPAYAATASASRLSKSPPRASPGGGGPGLRRSPSGRESSKTREDKSARAKNEAEEAERLRKVAAKRGAASGDSDEEATDIVDLLGGDGSGPPLGLIDFNSMSVDDAADLIWERMRAFMKDNGGAKALEMFKALDIDGNGTIDLGEFTSALADMGIHGVPTKMAKAVMSTADGDNDGVLEYAELMPMLEESREAASKRRAAARKKKDEKKTQGSDGSEWELTFDVLLYDQDLEDFDAKNQGFYGKTCAEALGVEEKQVQVAGVRESAEDRALKVATLVKGCESENEANDLGEKAKNLFVLAAALKKADLGRARIANTTVRDSESAAKAARAKMNEERKAKAAAVSQEIKRIKEEEAAAAKKKAEEEAEAEAAEAAAVEAAREKAEKSKARKSLVAAEEEEEKEDTSSSTSAIRVGSPVRVALGRSTESGVVVAVNDGGPRPRGGGHNAAAMTYDVKLNASGDGTEPLLVSAVPLSRLTPESASSSSSSALSVSFDLGHSQKRPLQVQDQVIIASDAPCMPGEAGVISAFRSLHVCDVHLSRSRMVFEGVPLRFLALQHNNNSNNHNDGAWHEDWLVPGTSVTVLGPPGGVPLYGIVQAARAQGKSTGEAAYDVAISSTGSMVTGVPAAKVIPDFSLNGQASPSSSRSGQEDKVPDGMTVDVVAATFTAPILGLTLGSNPQKGGAVVVGLTAGGPAQLLGVHTGDVLRTIGNIKLDVRDRDPAATATAHLSASSRPVELRFTRMKSTNDDAPAGNGGTASSEASGFFDLTLNAQSAPKHSPFGATFALQPFQPAVARSSTAAPDGATSPLISPEKGPSDEAPTTPTEALVVTAVEANSPANACGLRAGSAIVGLNGVYWHGADRRQILTWASEVMQDLLTSAARPAVLHCMKGDEKEYSRMMGRKSSVGNMSRKMSESSSPSKLRRASSTPVLNRRRSSASSPYGASFREPSPPRSTWHHLDFVHSKAVGCVLEAKKNAAATAEAIEEAQERGEKFSKKDNVMDVVVRYCEKGSEAMLLGLKKGDRLHQVGTVVLGSKGTVKQANELLNVATRPLSVVFERPPPKAASEKEVASLPGMPAMIDYGSCDEALGDKPGSYSRLRFLRMPLFPLGLQVKVSQGRLLVTTVKEMPPEAGQDYGLRAGDEIVEINGVPWSDESGTEKRVNVGAPTAVTLRRSAGLGHSAYCFENLVANVARPMVLTVRRAPPRNSCVQSCALALVRLTFTSGDGDNDDSSEAYEAPKGHKPAKYSVQEVEKARKAKKSAPAEEDDNKGSRRLSFLSRKTAAEKRQASEKEEEKKPVAKKSDEKKTEVKKQNDSPTKGKPFESKRKKKVETPPQSSSSESSSSSEDEEEIDEDEAMLAGELASSSSSGSDSEESL